MWVRPAATIREQQDPAESLEGLSITLCAALLQLQPGGVTGRAIQTRYIGPSNVRDSRIAAFDKAGNRVVVSCDDSLKPGPGAT